MSTPGRAVPAGQEITDLREGMDFRDHQYRREVFLRFYEFHLKHRSHPGAVYYIMPYLRGKCGWTLEQALWFAYLNGNTQNPVTSWLIMREFPCVHTTSIEKLTEWFNAYWSRLQFDTDRRHHKRIFPQAVAKYQALVGDSQEAYFLRKCTFADEQRNFRQLWAAKGEFYGFGRLSMFSYLEYLRIMGLPIQCDSLFLTDLEGSKSHRNGLCKVLGRDDLDWHDSNPSFPGYSKAVLGWLEEEAVTLLREANDRLCSASFSRDVGYFTLESALCTYKSWHRPNRRYPNVYNDLLHDRIRWAEMRWGERLDMFWDCRKAALPEYLRLEDTAGDPGVSPVKQNWYRETGQVILMDREWSCFKNDYGRKV